MYDFNKAELKDKDICRHISNVSLFNYNEVKFVYNMIFYLIYEHLQTTGNLWKYYDLIELENRYLEPRPFVNHFTKTVDMTRPRIELIVKLNEIFKSRLATKEEIDDYKQKQFTEELI